MNYSVNNNVNFKGYDAIKLKGLYMQGFVKENELGICRQMKKIAEKEHLKFFINQNDTVIKNDIEDNVVPADFLTRWGQDRKAFLKNGENNIVMCDRRNKLIDLPDELSSYKMRQRTVLPRGGNYYIGYRHTGEKWMIINGDSVADYFYHCGEHCNEPERIAMSNIKWIYGIEKENICVTDMMFRDLDMLIRPIGYPYVLVNSTEESLKNIEKMHEKFPQSDEIYKKLVDFSEVYAEPNDCNELYKKLKRFGFVPIKIGGFYSEDICFLNSIAFKNDDNKISLISNSTQHSCPELEYLEELFEKDLRDKVPEIGNIYFVSGGKKTQETFGENDWVRTHNFPEQRFNEHHNVIMDWLGEHHGGIHCMTAEIPDFNKLNCIV